MLANQLGKHWLCLINLCVHAQGNEQFKQLQQQLSTVLTRALHKVRGKIMNFQKQMGSTEESQAIQKQADMLTANIYRCFGLAWNGFDLADLVTSPQPYTLECPISNWQLQKKMSAKCL